MDPEWAETTMALGAALLDALGQAVVAAGPDGRVLYLNPAAEALYGWGAEEARGSELARVVGTLGDPRSTASLVRATAGEAWAGELDCRRRDGTRFPAWVTSTPFFDDEGRHLGTVGVWADITERVSADLRFDAAFEQSPIGMVIADLEGRPTAVNPAICRMLGRPAEELLHQYWVPYGVEGDPPLGASVLATIRGGGDTHTEERRYRRPDGTVVWLLAHVTHVRDADGTAVYFMAQMQDVTQRRLAEEQLTHQALHDELTGLPNRTVLNRELDRALADAERVGSRVGVAFIDLDGFKYVNDALGHVAGDELLVQVGDRLVGNLRHDDIVVRFGGDEYVVVCHDVTERSMAELTEAVTAAMTEPYQTQGRQVDLHASVGITVSRPGSTSHALLSEADAAMYRAKELGRDRTVLFDESLRRHSAAVLEGEQSLRGALARQELEVHYQPIVDLAEDRPVGVEALVRWRAGDGRLRPPAEFIPVAESSGLIVRIGAWVLERAAADVAAWNAAAPDRAPLWVSVNLSARQLGHRDLPQLVAGVLERSGLPAPLLHLEITETVVMQDVTESVAVLQELKQVGVQLSIDDFGTGYSSLAYLKALPVDMLKIDRSFVRDLGSDADGASIVAAVLSLGATLRMRCLAEGVETPLQRAALRELGCPLAQGYLWTPPLPEAEASRWLDERAVRPPGRPGPAAR